MMHRIGVRRGFLAALAAGALGGALISSSGTAHAATPPNFTLANVGQFGGEPSLTTDSNGVLYDSTPSATGSGNPPAGPPGTYRSTDRGASWAPIQSADSNSGDSCLATDESNALYWCNLASTTQGHAPLQADVWKTVVGPACTTNCSWTHGDGAVPAACSTSCNPFGVDRQWTAASLLTATVTNQAEVVIMYHDFYGPSSIWINKSTDGGATFGAPQNVLASLSPGTIPGTVTAEGYSFCNTVPTGIGIVKQGLPHAGRIYVSWIAADPVQNATGCNVSMAQAFHTLWVAYSDDNGSTWSPQMAYDAGPGHDASTPFAAFTLDKQGNPYIAFDSMDVSSSTNFASCATESGATLQADTSCNFKMYVVWCQCGGASVSFGDGLGTIGGSASKPYLVNPNVTGTSVFPTIAAGDPGKVDVGWLQTPTVVPTDPAGKFDPGGCAGAITGNPPTYPDQCHWDLYEGQSLNLTLPPSGSGSASWVSSKITSSPMHLGDICNLGIACGPTSNRNLLDFNQEVVDPTTGCAHIAYADDNTVNKLRAANQIDGPSIIGSGNCSLLAVGAPEAPLTILLPLAAGAVLVAVGVRRRRRGSALPPPELRSRPGPRGGVSSADRCGTARSSPPCAAGRAARP